MASETTSTDTSTRSMTSIYKYYYENLDLQTLGVDNSQPTLFEELVPGHPTHIGACDAAKSGAGVRTRVKLINPTMKASH